MAPLLRRAAIIMANRKSYLGFPTSHQPRFYAAPNFLKMGIRNPNLSSFIQVSTIKDEKSPAKFHYILECGSMPNVMVALPNIGGALCSTPQSLADAPTRCRAVTLPKRETSWNLQGCPKWSNRSQPLVGWSSLYYEDMWRTYWCLKSFFVLSASRVQHISDLHSKFALRPHHVWKYGRP